MVIARNMPFHDKPGRKSRPVVVLSSDHHNQVRQDVVVASISSQPVEGPWDLNVPEWCEAGLKMPSKVICDSISTVLQDSVMPVGCIEAGTLADVRMKMAMTLDLCYCRACDRKR